MFFFISFSSFWSFSSRPRHFMHSRLLHWSGESEVEGLSSTKCNLNVQFNQLEGYNYGVLVGRSKSLATIITSRVR